MIHPVTASASVKPCEMRLHHVPEPVITQGHHIAPVYLQQRLWGEVRLYDLLYLCGNDHDALHAWIYYRMGERRQPDDPGRLIKAEAERVLDWWRTAAR